MKIRRVDKLLEITEEVFSFARHGAAIRVFFFFGSETREKWWKHVILIFDYTIYISAHTLLAYVNPRETFFSNTKYWYFVLKNIVHSDILSEHYLRPIEFFLNAFCYTDQRSLAILLKVVRENRHHIIRTHK